MKFYNHRHKKVKRYRKKSTFEYALVFSNSEKLVEYVCSKTLSNITSSSLYTHNGYYKLLITSNTPPVFCKNIILKDKFHIAEIKQKNKLICKYNAIYKLKKAFKKP